MEEKFRFRNEAEVDTALSVVRLYQAYLEWREETKRHTPVAMRPTIEEFMEWLGEQVQENTVS